MTVLMIFISLFFSFHSQASLSSVEASGKVFYTMPDQSLVFRDVVLSVPMRGQGDVVLKWSTGEQVADSFFYRKQNGRTVFYVVFKNPPQAPQGTVLVLKGTYTRGSNLALYYGDMFTKSGNKFSQNEVVSLNKWSYTGGFYFKADVPQE